MKRLILVVVFASIFWGLNAQLTMLKSGDNSSQDDYVPLVNYDRIWEYHMVSHGWDVYEHCLFQMKFDGEELRNGKTYHIFTFTGNEIYWSTCEGVYNNDMKVLQNRHTDKFLIREEDSKVYLFNDLSVKAGLDGVEKNDGEEILLYNFNLKPDEAFKAVSLRYRYNDFDILGDLTLWEHRIDVIETEIIEEQECTVQRLSTSIPGIFAIEGIGCVDYGILPIYKLSDYEAAYEDYYGLNRVYGKNEEIIYQRPYNSVDAPSSINNINEEVSLSFNDGIIEVNDAGKLNTIKIFNLNGEVVMAADGYDKVQLNTKELNPGIYIAKAGFKTLKIVVK